MHAARICNMQRAIEPFFCMFNAYFEGVGGINWKNFYLYNLYNNEKKLYTGGDLSANISFLTLPNI